MSQAMIQERIVTLTVNPALDRSCTVDHVVPGPKLRCSTPIAEPGGGGVNVARVIHTLGGEASALWTCGGLTGEAMRRLLDAQGVTHVPIAIAGDTRESFHVQEQGDGPLYRFVTPGPELRAEEVDACLQQMRNLDPPPRYLVVSGSLPPGVGAGFCRRVVTAAPKGCRTIVDTSGEPLREATNEGLFFIKPNLRELGQLAGKPVTSDAEAAAAARRIIDRGRVEAVVASLGAGGAILVTRDAIEPIRAPTVQLRSKVGAGDSTVAGIVLALARGMPLRDAARFGVAAGAAAVMTPGTQLCRRADVERLYAEMTR